MEFRIIPSKTKSRTALIVENMKKILLLALTSLLITGIQAEENDPIEHYMLDHMFDAPAEDFGKGVAGLKNSMADINVSIAQARQDFWAGLPEAGKKLSHLLSEKDLYYLMSSIDAKLFSQLRLVGADMLGGEMDGGIPFSAIGEFSDTGLFGTP